MQQAVEMRSARPRSSDRGSRNRAAGEGSLYKVTFERDAERFKAKAEETAKTSQRGQDAGRKTSGPMPTEKEDETSRGRQRACREDELGSNNWRRTFWILPAELRRLREVRWWDRRRNMTSKNDLKHHELFHVHLSF